MALRPLQKVLTEIGTLAAHPAAFLVVLAYAAVWFVFDRAAFDMHGVATLIVWTMTLLIQRAEHRDTQALHAKLDELLRAQGDARDELINIDKKEPEEIEAQRERERPDAGRHGTT